MTKITEKLKRFVIANKTKPDLPYINLTDDNRYAGWVNASGSNSDNLWLKLDLKKEWDTFCLFVLASAWSRQGRWENAVHFVIAIREKFTNIKSIDFDKLRNHCDFYTKKHGKILKGTGKTRIMISFGQDLYRSIKILCKNWSEIKRNLDKSGKSGDWKGFIRYLRGVKGLGNGNKAMKIKILLILRELRCQNIYKNIPGDLCCVPDKRVKEAYEDGQIGNLRGYIKASKQIYEDFGDLFDIPAFAYNDYVG